MEKWPDVLKIFAVFKAHLSWMDLFFSHLRLVQSPNVSSYFIMGLL